MITPDQVIERTAINDYVKLPWVWYVDRFNVVYEPPEYKGTIVPRVQPLILRSFNKELGRFNTVTTDHRCMLANPQHLYTSETEAQAALLLYKESIEKQV